LFFEKEAENFSIGIIYSNAKVFLVDFFKYNLKDFGRPKCRVREAKLIGCGGGVGDEALDGFFSC